MKIRTILSVALGLSTLLMVGCASTGVEESNSAITSVEDVDPSTGNVERAENNINISNTPVPRGYNGQPINSMSPQEKLRRSRR